jgi:hypothetical protein
MKAAENRALSYQVLRQGNIRLRVEIGSLRFGFEKPGKLFMDSSSERFVPPSKQLSLFVDRKAEVNPSKWLPYIHGHNQDLLINKINVLLSHHSKKENPVNNSETLASLSTGGLLSFH